MRNVIKYLLLGIVIYLALFSQSNFIAGRAGGGLLAIGLFYIIEKLADRQDKKYQERKKNGNVDDWKY